MANDEALIEPNFYRKAPRDPKELKKSSNFARNVTIGVLLTYMTLAAIGAAVMMNMEQNKTGFQQIEVTQPIWFFDKTYMKDTREVKK